VIGFGIALGLFLALAVLKFGSPVVLDNNIPPPTSLSEFLFELWPVRWAYFPFVLVALVGLSKATVVERVQKTQAPVWLLVAPLVWLGWQALASTHSVDATLTRMTMPHLTVCVACFALSFLVLGRDQMAKWFWIMLSLGLAVCLIKAARQHLFEFRMDYQRLVEGQQSGWTNFAPSTLIEMQQQNLLVLTNGAWAPNPVILTKLEKGRVYGTLVYPNALANLLLLLGPWLMVQACRAADRLRPSVRWLAGAMAVLLVLGNFYWTGSKAAWLLALGMGAAWLFTREMPSKLKWLYGGGIVAAGVAAFLFRFSSYLEKGATSATARFDYWKVAWRVAVDNPVFGSGPGTFQRPYALAKPAEAEMTRLVHNDFLQQASDAGWLALAAYLVWVGGLLWMLFPKVKHDPLKLALWFGFAGWCAHSFADFCLYVPPNAWIAFTIAGWLLGGESQIGSTGGSGRGTHKPSL
jgi:hypothetical protein